MQYCITYHIFNGYMVYCYDKDCKREGIVVLFNRTNDAQAVIDNPNFREILDTIYK